METIENKVCGICKKKLPKTDKYFFKRIIKQALVTGEIKSYISYKSLCKKCHSLQGNNIRVKKRCKEMNCDVSDYRENWKKQYSENRTFIKEISHLPKGVQTVIRKKIKSGYVFTTYNKYRIDFRKNLSQAKRKYEYGDLEFIPKGTQSGFIQITDAYVSNTLGFKVNEVPKEIIETKRLIIKLRRELKTIK